MLAHLKYAHWTHIRNLFWAGWWLFALLALAWTGLHWLTGDLFLPVRMVNYVMPWLLLGLVPGLALAALARHKTLAMVLAVPALFVAVSFAPLFLPPATTVLAGGISFKVMSYNLLYVNRDVAAISRLIWQEQPDILLMQEVTPFHARNLPVALADLYPGQSLHVAYASEIGQVIISRYPMTSEGIDRKARIQKVSLETPAGRVKVWNVHARTPSRWQQHYQDLSAMAIETAQVEGPLIVGGDFNTTDQSELYRLINRHLDNAHWEAGWGFGFSFPAESSSIYGVPIPGSVVRIDHIFYSGEHFLARHARTLAESGGSDHLPVVVTLFLTR